MGGLPMQVNLINDVNGLAQHLANMADQSRLEIISVWHSPQP
jgi:hypothetical protein